MSGIAGIWHRDGRPVKTDALRAMAEIQSHRGRDGIGTWCSGDFGMSHCRLSIIDLSDNGRQPMVSPDRRFHICFNGEIHNYIELKKELSAAGCEFHTATDTEVVLASYRHWGAACFNRFNGMWAIALWDDARRELVLCRDRYGIKPLFISLRGNRLAFASEAKALVRVFAEEREPDLAQIGMFLRTGATDIGDRTFFHNIKMLPPATIVRVSGDSVRHGKYWTFVPGAESPRADAVGTVRELLIDAVRIRLRSDAPMGIWVSGGLDSAAIARIAARLLDRPIHCYSLRYEGWKDDESAYAAAVTDDSRRYVRHWTTPDPAGILDTIADLTWHHDAPCISRGRYPMWFVARDSSRINSVILTGDGSDEMLGGYDAFMWPYLYDRLKHRAPRGGEPRMSWLREFADLLRVNPQSVAGILRKMSAPLYCKLGLGAFRRCPVVSSAFHHAHRVDDPGHHIAGWLCSTGVRPYRSELNNALWREVTVRGLPELLHGFDAVSMAHTLELRAPFLDHRLVEFVFSLPYDEKIRDGWTKSLLRRAVADLLPREVLFRRRKLGFRYPVNESLTRPENLRAALDLLADGSAVNLGIFDRRRVSRVFRHAAAGVSGEELWRWVSLEHWLRRFITAA